jgi:hypothetical protein
MATTRQRVDRNTFKQIFRDHWRPFQQGHPRYQDRHVQAVIDKMLGCGTPESGLYHVCVPALSGREAGGLQLQEQLLPLLLQGVCG